MSLQKNSLAITLFVLIALSVVLFNASCTRPEVSDTTQQNRVPRAATTAQEPARITAAERAAKEAQSFAATDPIKSMETLEAAIAADPSNPAAAQLYLLLGMQKHEFQHASEKTNVSYEQMRAYAQARPDQFVLDESSDEYLYNGFHFEELIRRFPKSPFRVDASYEMTKLSQAGECEGWVTCYIEADFAQVRAFLYEYPDTKFSTEAVARADKAFRSNLWGEEWKSPRGPSIVDPLKPADGYDPEVMKRLVGEYEDLAPVLPPRLRASAYETVAYYRARFGETAQARKLYMFIVNEVPDYKNITEVRKALAALK